MPNRRNNQLIWHSLLGIALLGCQNATTSYYQKPANTVEHKLTTAERERRHELFDDITSKPPHGVSIEECFEGKAASDYREFLALADETWKDDDGKWYYFVFRTDSPSDPERFEEGDSFLSINVREGTIVLVNYAVMIR